MLKKIPFLFLSLLAFRANAEFEYPCYSEGDAPAFLEDSSCCTETCNPCNNWGVWVEGEYLYWKACLSDSRVGIISTIPPRTGENTFHYLSYDRQSGVRASIGIDGLCSCWNLWGSYTYIRPEGKISLEAPIEKGSFILSDFMVANFGNEVAAWNYDFSTSLFQEQKIKYQTYDVLLSRDFEVCCLEIHPFFGVTGLLLDQTLNFSTANGLNTIAFDTTIDYSGVGLKTGVNIVYPLSKCFNIFTRSSFAMVAGSKDYRLKADGVTNDSAPVPVTFASKGNACVYLPGFDIQIGLSYTANWCNKFISFKLGWEFLQWSNVPQINQINTTNDTLTLGMQGLTAGASVLF